MDEIVAVVVCDWCGALVTQVSTSIFGHAGCWECVTANDVAEVLRVAVAWRRHTHTEVVAVVAVGVVDGVSARLLVSKMNMLGRFQGGA